MLGPEACAPSAHPEASPELREMIHLLPKFPAFLRGSFFLNSLLGAKHPFSKDDSLSRWADLDVIIRPDGTTLMKRERDEASNALKRRIRPSELLRL
jgi:hypothetical protein